MEIISSAGVSSARDSSIQRRGDCARGSSPSVRLFTAEKTGKSGQAPGRAALIF